MSHLTLGYLGHRAWVYFIYHNLLGRSGLLTLGIALVIAAEALFRDWHKTAMYRLFFRRSISARVDIAFFLSYMTGIGPLIEIAFTFGIAILGTRLADAADGRLAWARITLPGDNIAGLIFSVTIYWIMANLQGYWMHRLFHSPLFWHAHRFHHSATELDFLTRFRIHPLEALTRVISLLSPLIILKAPAPVVLASGLIGDAVMFLQHSELPWTLGWFGRWLFSAPIGHQIHHSTDERHLHTNYSVCPLWDHVFGTWYGGQVAPVTFGVYDSGYDRPVRQLFLDTRNLYGHIPRWLALAFRRRTQEFVSLPCPPGSATVAGKAVTAAVGADDAISCALSGHERPLRRQ